MLARTNMPESRFRNKSTPLPIPGCRYKSNSWLLSRPAAHPDGLGTRVFLHDRIRTRQGRPRAHDCFGSVVARRRGPASPRLRTAASRSSVLVGDALADRWPRRRVGQRRRGCSRPCPAGLPATARGSPRSAGVHLRCTSALVGVRTRGSRMSRLCEACRLSLRTRPRTDCARTARCVTTALARKWPGSRPPFLSLIVPDRVLRGERRDRPRHRDG
jgi:hypothetical protein